MNNMLRKQKILVCGDVDGNFKTLFSRVNAINEKSGPFDFLFCVGDFFADSIKKLEPYKNGSLTVSVPTYILGPNKENHVSYYEDLSGCEICPNVNYLGKQGILSSNGLKIAYVSGLEGNKNQPDIKFTEKDAMKVRDAALRTKDGSQFIGVDVLLTSEWPKDVTRFDKNTNLESDKEGSLVLSKLACQLKPRYHFSGLKNVFYERPPYKNCSGDDANGSGHGTRFIGLAKVGNVGKNKWLYAASLTPLSELKSKDLYQTTTDETECPYSGLTKKGDSSEGNQYFYDMNAKGDDCDNPRKRRRESHSENEKKKMNFDDPETCWFCLASSSVEKHLVISIGEEVYVALPKGGLNPLHVMIVPIKHHRAQTELSGSAVEEIKKYKAALKKFYKTKEMVPVVFERNYKTSHLQLHVIPVPKDLSGVLKKIFLDFSDDYELKLSEMPNKCQLKDFVQPGTPYFYLELPTKEKFMCSCQKNFPIHFGRDVLACKAVLNMPDKVNWRDCIRNKQEEEKMAQDFREEFEVFDDVS